MKTGVPWSVKGIRPEVRESAREAARRSGMSLSEWLNSVIINTAAQEGVDPHAHDDDDDSDLSSVHQRFDDLTRRIDRLAAAGPQVPAAVARYAPPMHASGGLSGIDQAVAEIAARQRALDGEPAGHAPAMPSVAMAPRAPMPTQDLSGLEQQLRNITSQIETLRRPGVEEAINALRSELSEIGQSLTEAMPRRALDAIEKEVHGLTQRIADNRQSGADNDALAGIEHGLNEVRDALRSLTPAENLVGFNDAVNGLAHKIDLIVAQKDPHTLQQLEDAITTLRGISSNVASDETVGRLASDVHMLAVKVDQIAGAGAAIEALGSLEQRIAALSDALAARSQNGDSVPPLLEALVHSLSDKIEQIQLTRGDALAVGHLEDRIVKLVEKLDASDSRLVHLEAIERGLADLLVHIEDIRANKNADGLRAEVPPVVDALQRDLARTQDSLEAVHGTLGHMVDRMAMLEQGIRSEPVPPPPPPLPPAPTLKEPVQTTAARMMGAEAPQSAPPPPAAATRPQLMPGRKSEPIDPDLPPDHPLEPGAARPRHAGTGASPAARIAASEAALAPARPPVIPDPGGKSDFIAAARRAAHAAALDPSPRVATKNEPDKAPTQDKPRSSLSKRIKSLFVASSIVIAVAGSLQILDILTGGADQPGTAAQKSAKNSTDTNRQIAVVRDAPPQTETPAASNPAGSTALILTVPEAAFSSVPALNGLPPINTPGSDITGSIAQKNPSKTTMPGLPAFPPYMPPHAGADANKIPIAIGGAALRNAAAAGDAAAAYEIAARYADGQGVARSPEEAVSWFERAADKGLAPAQFRLASMYEKGQGVKKDLKIAQRLYSAAAEKGNAKAMHNLAVLYAEGIDGKPDYRMASQWFRKAADRGVSDSQYNLGILYARGIGIDKNLTDSYKWFSLAAAQGDKESAKKRDEVAARLDAAALAAAQAAIKAFVAEPQPEQATHVPIPSGGWDRSTSETPPPPGKKSAGGVRVGAR
ncbi:MAG: hypothetical protein WCI56_10635 [Hyphomicrobiales bacterium]